MKKHTVIAILLGVISGLAVTGVYVWSRGINKRPATENTQIAQPQVKQLSWDDPAGFTFQYPEVLSINKHDEDKDNYAHVELTNSSQPGNVIVWAKDTTALDVNAWVKTEKAFKDANIFDTTLGGQPGKRVLITTPRKVIIGTIFDGLLWEVETNLGEGDYWQGITDTITNSFTFKPLPTQATSKTGGGESSVDEEEVVE